MIPTADHTAAAQYWHDLAISDVLFRLDAAMDRGLSQNEAKRRLAEHGPNTLPEAKHPSMWKVFAGQFASPLIYILFVAAVIALVMGHRGDAGVILIVVFVNALIGSVQEGRAERSMESLRKLSSLKVRVRRDGKEEIIDAHDLVPGGIVLLAAGDAVAADARLLEAAALEAAEAALTGESMPVSKRRARCHRARVSDAAILRWLSALGATLEAELACYDGVIFLRAQRSVGWPSKARILCATKPWSKPWCSMHAGANSGCTIHASCWFGTTLRSSKRSPLASQNWTAW